MLGMTYAVLCGVFPVLCDVSSILCGVSSVGCGAFAEKCFTSPVLCGASPALCERSWVLCGASGEKCFTSSVSRVFTSWPESGQQAIFHSNKSRRIDGLGGSPTTPAGLEQSMILVMASVCLYPSSLLYQWMEHAETTPTGPRICSNRRSGGAITHKGVCLYEKNRT